jgi:hypothetical protein
MVRTGASKKRTLAAYSLHARDNAGVIDYVEYFQSFFASGSDESRFAIFGETVAVTYKQSTAAEAGEGVIRFVAGSEEDPPLFFDIATGEERAVDSRGGIFVRGVWTFVNAAQRIFVLEAKRPGVSVAQIEQYLELIGTELGYKNLRFDLNPAPSSEFADEVRKLSRIRTASLTLRQPNLDWGETEVEVHKYAEKSGAARVTIEMGAGRGQELDPAHGIVRDIVDLARKPITSLKNVAVTGTAPGDAGEKTISLQKFQRKTNVSVAAGATAGQELEVFQPAARELSDAAAAAQLEAQTASPTTPETV